MEQFVAQDHALRVCRQSCECLDFFWSNCDLLASPRNLRLGTVRVLLGQTCPGTLGVCHERFSSSSVEAFNPPATGDLLATDQPPVASPRSLNVRAHLVF